MSLFPIPKRVIGKIVAIQRSFLWSGNSSKKDMPLVAWDIITLPKHLGGLGLGNLHHKNTALLFKWIWRFLNEPNALWRQVVQGKYGIKDTFTTRDISLSSYSGPWNGICNSILKFPHAKNLASLQIRKQIGDGSHTLFWHDLWVGVKPLKSECPRLFRLSLQQDACVSMCGFWDGLGWRWSLLWSRTLRQRDLIEQASLLNIIDQPSSTS